MFRILLAAFAAFAGPSMADATIPTEDIPGAADSALVGRIDGAFIVDYAQLSFDEATYPLSRLEQVTPPERDERNNYVHLPEESVTVEGKRSRIVYLLPEGASPLEAIRTYQRGIEGAEVLYECADSGCGGDGGKASGGGGGHQSLGKYLWPARRIAAADFSTGRCAQTESISDQRYTLVRVPGAYLSVHAYVNGGWMSCAALAGRAVAIVDVIETGEMQDRLVTVTAEDMASEIAQTGSISLYGITFATDSAEITGDSATTLAEIAALLEASPDLRLLIVGHTDSVGSFDYNQALSERRARAVVAALTRDYRIAGARLYPVGVSFASPKASNASEEGRAQNRRVELVRF